MEFVRVGQQVFRLDGIIRALWRGSKLVLFFGEGVTQVEGESADAIWRELVRRAERPEALAGPDLAESEAAGAVPARA